MAHATLDTDKLIPHTRSALVDTITSLQGSDVGMIATSYMHELHTKIHDIVDNALSKLVGNTACVLASL